MKHILFLILIIFLTLSLFSCKNSVGSINLNDINSHKQFQNDAIDKGSNYKEKFEIIRGLISDYRAIGESKSSKYLNYYLSRLYSYYSFDKESIDSLWYEPIKLEMKNYDTYRSFVDSAFYFTDLAVQEDSTNLYALTNYINITVSAAQLPLTIKGLYKYFDYRGTLNTRINNILPYTDKILMKDTTVGKNLSLTALWNSFIVIDLNLASNSINIDNSNTKNLIIKLDEYVSKFNSMKHLVSDPSVANYPSELRDKYKEYIAEANVSVEEYENLGCTKLWIYSNGKYKQELYEMDIESIPYDERMRLTSYDLKNCNYPGAKIYLTRKSEGTYKVVGSYFYFYANSGSSDILAGYDSEKGLYYLRKDDSGNFKWVNPVTYEDMSFRRVR